jgi:S1-C subfamily serine protease
MDRIERHLPQDLRGVLVTEATMGGWAHIAGISAGQIILRIGGHAVGDPRSFERAIESIVADRPDVVLVFLRAGRRTTFRFIEPDWPKAKDKDAKAKKVNTKHSEAKPAAGRKPGKEKQ